MRARILPALAVLLLATSASAETPDDATGDVATPPAPPPPPTATITRPPALGWHRGEFRPFVATAIDAGYIYGRPRLSLGYGQPFSQWVGIDVNPVASNRFLGAYAGFRVEIPYVDLRLGARYIWAFQQSYLAPRDGYNRLDFESQDYGRSHYVSPEAELTGVVPVGIGDVIAVASVSLLTGVPSGLYVYDETLRAILKPPTIWRGRLGYTFRFGNEGKIHFGPVVDILGIPGRSEHIVRAGVIGSASLSDHVDVLGSLVPPILSPDSIGIAGGDFAQLGVRYRWASGMD